LSSLTALPPSIEIGLPGTIPAVMRLTTSCSS
jgi:hypothetical protein